MFSKKVVQSARFVKMPSSSRCLYYDLGIEADDDGVVEAYNVMRMTGATEDDLRVLVAKNFVKVLNEDLVSVIMDWSTNNSIRSDRYHPSIYKDLLLQLDGNQLTTNCQPTDNQWYTEVRLGKDSIDKVNNSRATNKFVPPSLDEVKTEILDKGYNIDAEKFIAFYESKGWMIGKNKMKSWKSALVTWEKRNAPKPQQELSREINPTYDTSNNVSLSEEELKELQEMMKGRS